jgi:hypothetical protein
MKKKVRLSLAFSIFIIGIIIIALAGLVQALPFKYITVEKNISASFVAGSTQQIVVSFDNVAAVDQTTIAELRIVSENSNYSVNMGDFHVSGVLDSASDFGGVHVEESHVLKCLEKDGGVFWCYNDSETNRIVLPKSHNNLTLSIASHPALYPTNYTFNLTLYAEVGVPKVKKNVPANFTANEIKKIDVKNETDTILDIFITQNLTNVMINITTYDAPIVQTAFGVAELNKYIAIEASPELADNLSWVMIKMYYTDAEVAAAGLDESTLRIYYYNATDDSWEAYNPPRGGVNTAENYVWANATHFSLWGIFGSVPTPTIVAGVGGGGCVYEWNCTEWGECLPDGTQTRTCENIGNCPDSYRTPEATQPCNYTAPPVTPPTPPTPPTAAAPGIVGAVIGAIGGAIKKAPGVIIFIAALLVAVIIFLIVRKHQKE